MLFAVSHGENKNEKIGEYYYQNTVRTDFKIHKDEPATYSGGTPYKDCWEAYFGFVNGNWFPYKAGMTWQDVYLSDLGPIAWPSAGYLNQDGSLASNGVRHPSAIVADHFLYIYFVDSSKEGASGVKLVRASLADVLKPQAYETLTASGWKPALPEGFTKEKITSFFNVKGPASIPVLRPDQNTVRFSVARFIDGVHEFIGVEEYINPTDSIKVALRFSSDLIHWSDRTVLYTAKNWEESKLRYPIFLSQDGGSNTEIGKEGFFILGTDGKGTVTKLYVHSKAIQPASFQTFLKYDLQDPALAVPNPAYDNFSVNLQLNARSRVVAILYSMAGQKIARLIDESSDAGSYSRMCNIGDLVPGIYVLEVWVNKQRYRQKIKKL